MHDSNMAAAGQDSLAACIKCIRLHKYGITNQIKITLPQLLATGDPICGRHLPTKLSVHMMVVGRTCMLACRRDNLCKCWVLINNNWHDYGSGGVGGTGETAIIV